MRMQLLLSILTVYCQSDDAPRYGKQGIHAVHVRLAPCLAKVPDGEGREFTRHTDVPGPTCKGPCRLSSLYFIKWKAAPICMYTCRSLTPSVQHDGFGAWTHLPKMRIVSWIRRATRRRCPRCTRLTRPWVHQSRAAFAFAPTLDSSCYDQTIMQHLICSQDGLHRRHRRDLLRPSATVSLGMVQRSGHQTLPGENLGPLFL